MTELHLLCQKKHSEKTYRKLYVTGADSGWYIQRRLNRKTLHSNPTLRITVSRDVPKQTNTHESYTERTDVKSGSERSFGLVFSAVFAVVALWPLLDGGGVRVWAAIAAVVFVLAALVYPAVLKPLNFVWFKFGLLLHKIVNPIIMGMLFYLTIMPIGLIMRLSGKDILNLRIDKAARTYWIKRESPEPNSLRNQF